MVSENYKKVKPFNRIQNCTSYLSRKSKSSRTYVYAFGTGFLLYLILPQPAFAKEISKAAKNGAGQAAAGKVKISKAAACGMIAKSCGKVLDNSVPNTAVTNPKLFASFMCGATLAWCAKYIIMDK